MKMIKKKIIDSTVIEGLKKRYADMHPLLFCRSLEKAESAGELFDILETIPLSLPFSWDEKARRWKEVKELYFENKFESLIKNI